MSTNSYGSAAPYTGASLDDLHESIGIPQFSGTAAENWYLPWNGLLIQGGKVSVPSGTTTFPFVTGFPQQVLGIFLQSTDSGQSPGAVPISLSEFQIDHSGSTHDIYWWAIGV